MTLPEVVVSQLCEFVKARLDELEADAHLLSEGKSTGVITQSWIEHDIIHRRMLIKLYEDNLDLEGTSLAVSTLKWSIYSMADAWSDHPDYDRELWGE